VNDVKSIAQTGRQTILVIEDDSGILDLVREILVKGGYTVFGSLDPADALDRFSDEPIDLLLTDVLMPGMNGPEFVSAWERQNSKVEVLYMSGYTEEFFESGPISKDNLIEKPFTPTSLLRRVVEKLGNRADGH
jgi:two-component system cell cycle sensor histidine kinase/response regulator CckA